MKSLKDIPLLLSVPGAVIFSYFAFIALVNGTIPEFRSATPRYRAPDIYRTRKDTDPALFWFKMGLLTAGDLFFLLAIRERMQNR